MRVSLTHWTLVVATLTMMTVSTGCRSGMGWFGRKQGPNSSALASRPTPPSSSFAPGGDANAANTAPSYQASAYPDTADVSRASHSQPGAPAMDSGTRIADRTADRTAGAQVGSYATPNYLGGESTQPSGGQLPPNATYATPDPDGRYSDKASFTSQNFQNPGSHAQQNMGVTNQAIQSRSPQVQGAAFSPQPSGGDSRFGNSGQSWNNSPAAQPSGSSRFGTPNSVYDRGVGAASSSNINGPLQGIQGAPVGTPAANIQAPGTPAGATFNSVPAAVAPAAGGASRWGGSSASVAPASPITGGISSPGSQSWQPGSVGSGTPSGTSFR
jgi:hypothetical protein